MSDASFVERLEELDLLITLIQPMAKIRTGITQRVLDAWGGDYDIKRRNGFYQVELFEPSYEWSAWSDTLEQAVSLAAHKAIDGR